MLELVTAVATIATPVLVAVLGGIGWFVQHRLEKSQTTRADQVARIRELEDRLREDRVVIYNKLLEPFFILFTNEAFFAGRKEFKGKDKNEIALAQMLSVEYRMTGFKLSLIAPDAVVRSYNVLMQFFYRMEAADRPVEEKTVEWMSHMATLLLEIRKSMGNEGSQLERWEMIEWFMKDAAAIKRASKTLPVASNA